MGTNVSHACMEARSLEIVVSGENMFFAGVRVAEEAELTCSKVMI